MHRSGLILGLVPAGKRRRQLVSALCAFASAALAAPAPALVLGTHVHDLGAGAAWPPADFTHLRLWDARVMWSDLEPHRGQWQFDRLDRIVAENKTRQRSLLLPLGLSPPWASSRPDEPSAYRPGNAAPPRDEEDWRRYVTTVAQRYKGRIAAYEVWNEPNKARFFSGDVAQMVRFTCAARDALKAVDPSAMLVSPAATGQRDGLRWVDRFLAAGGAACVDVLAFHFYTLAHEPPEAMVPLVHGLRESMTRHGVANLPLWDTEFGWYVANERVPVPIRYRVLPPPLAGAYLARGWLLRAGLGLDRAYFYAWNNRKMGLIEPDTSTLKPGADMLPRANRWVQSSDHFARCQQDAGLWTCALRQPSSARGLVAWATAPAASARLRRMVGEALAAGASAETADGQSGAPADGVPVRMLWPEAARP